MHGYTATNRTSAAPSPSHSTHTLTHQPINGNTVSHKQDDDADEKSAEPLQDQIMFLCINLSRYSPNTQFILLSIGTIMFFLINSYVEEYLFSLLPGFQFGWFMTLVELCCFSLIAMCERKLLPTSDDHDGIMSHRATLRQHFYVGAAMTCSRGLTNVSLEYLSYPTQVIFKSAKLLTVMIGSVWLMSKSYTTLEYSSAILLAASAAMFSLGDSQLPVDTTSTEQAAFSVIGIVIVSASLVFDSLHSNTQDKLVRQYHASTAEAMLYTNMYAAALTLCITVAGGELLIAFAYCAAHPISWLLLVIRSFVIYFGVLCFITLVKSSGAVAATAVTTVRKIATIACSYIMFPKAITSMHLIGCLAFMVSVAMSFLVVKQQQAASKLQKYGGVPTSDINEKHGSNGVGSSGSNLEMITIDKGGVRDTMKTLRDKTATSKQ